METSRQNKKEERKKFGFYENISDTKRSKRLLSRVKVHVIANSCKSVEFFAGFYLLMYCWRKTQSLVFLQYEFQAFLLFW